MMNKKILPFKIEKEYYYNLSEKKYYNGDFFGALHEINKINSNSKSDFVRVNFWRGKILSDMLCAGQSNNCFFKILDNPELESTICFEIAKNFLVYNLLAQSKFYFERCIIKDKYNLFSQNATKNIKIIEKVQRMSKFKIIEGGKSKTILDATPKGNLERAQFNMKSVKKINYTDSFKKPLENAVEELKNNNCDNAIKICKDVVEKSENLSFENIFALCLLLTSSYENKDKSGVNKYSKELEKFADCDDIKVWQMIATSLSSVKQHSYAKIFLDKIEKQAPYDYNILFMNAVCHYNAGFTKDAVQKMVKVKDLLGDNLISNFYYNEFKSGNQKEFEYSYSLPDSESKKIIKSLNIAIKAKDIKLTKQNKDKIKWVVFNKKINLFIEILNVLLENQSSIYNTKQFINELLIDVFLPDTIKLQIINFIIHEVGFRKINAVVNYKYVELEFLNTKYLKSISPSLINAYATSYCMLLKESPIRIKRLNVIVKTAYQTIKKQGKDLKLDENKLIKVIKMLVFAGSKTKTNEILNDFDYYVDVLGLKEFCVF